MTSDATKVKTTGAGGAFYCLAVIGAMVHYFQTATGFWNGVLGFFQALLWPAFLVYEALHWLQA